MSTTLVNVGILNGRSTKLDTDDLTVLSEIVENYSTNVTVSTPEIVLPNYDSQVETSNSSSTEVDGVFRRTDEADAIKPSSTITSKNAEQGSGSVVVDEAALIASLGLPARENINEKSLAQSLSESAPNVATENTQSQALRNELAQSETPDTSTDDQMGASQIIERAKLAAIETAMLAAANTAAMASTPLLQPPKQAETRTPTETEADAVRDEADSVVEQTEIELPNENVDSIAQGKSPVGKAVERLRRENLVVEEITSELASRMEDDALRVDQPITKVSDKTVAILAPTEKQYDRLVENLLEKTVPGMPASMIFAASEHNSKSGKVASSVAAMLAEKNLGKVLLIDADLAEKSLTDSLIDSHEPGLIEILNRDEQIENAIMQSGMDNLFYLPAGIADLASEKTMAGRMAALNQQLKQSFRFVIIDGGSSNEMVCRTMSSFCESTYLVVSLGQSYCSTASDAVSELQTAGARLLGTVVTK